MGSEMCIRDRYYWHLLLVLLGYRPSIASKLRSYLIPAQNPRRRLPRSYGNLIARFRGRGSANQMFTSTACYLCFCSGGETTVVEKDLITARVSSGSDFIVITNNDEQDVDGAEQKSNAEDGFVTLADIIEEARERKECAESNWRDRRTATAKQHGLRSIDGTAVSRHLDLDDVVALTQRFPTTNEMTHFACVMDPKEGTIAWCRRWVAPVGARWVKEHSSIWP